MGEWGQNKHITIIVNVRINNNHNNNNNNELLLISWYSATRIKIAFSTLPYGVKSN